MIFSLHFASRTVYRSLLYVLKVAMRAKSKRIQTTHNICKFYLHLYKDQQESKFSVSYLAMDGTVGDFLCTSFIQRYLCLSIFCCTFTSRGNFWKACKTITIFEKDSWRLFQIIQLYLNLFTPSQVTNVNTYLHMLCTKNKNTFYTSKTDFIQKCRFNFKKLSLVLFYCLKTLT